MLCYFCLLLSIK